MGETVLGFTNAEIVLLVGIVVNLFVSGFTLYRQRQSEKSQSGDDYAKQRFNALLEAYHSLNNGLYRLDFSEATASGNKEDVIRVANDMAAFLFETTHTFANVIFYFFNKDDDDELGRAAAEANVLGQGLRMNAAAYKEASPDDVTRALRIQELTTELVDNEYSFLQLFRSALVVELTVLDRRLSRNLKRSKKSQQKLVSELTK